MPKTLTDCCLRHGEPDTYNSRKSNEPMPARAEIKQPQGIVGLTCHHGWHQCLDALSFVAFGTTTSVYIRAYQAHIPEYVDENTRIRSTFRDVSSQLYLALCVEKVFPYVLLSLSRNPFFLSTSAVFRHISRNMLIAFVNISVALWVGLFQAAFGITECRSTSVDRSSCDMASVVYRGTELQSHANSSHIDF